ncbi:hypothetical protein [Pelistega suis]|uniref:hypothetical protein n=1 Tax=Pelistega suis TaxID=1631957 RepID=UPI00211CC2CE|nr:hypothetical protein [Pelistega suis]MCQ9329014.1 hypothetical protein [Pelistega suis]
MTPFGTIHFPDDIYEEDYTLPSRVFQDVIFSKNLFVHEMTHVWQYQYTTQLADIRMIIAKFDRNPKNAALLPKHNDV